MKPALIALLAFTYALAHAAEWLSYGGDPQRSGWQRREKDLNTVSVRRLKLLWKRQLDNQSKGLNSLTAPTLLGPIFTHRGVKELVIIAGASDNVYAVDADLGKVFWKRHLGTAPPDPHSEWPCGAGLTATPVIAPPASKIRNDEEASTPLRPIYVLSSDGRLHKIRPTDGEDMAPALPFIPMNANSSSLNLVDRSIYTTTSGGCGGASDGVWSIDVSSPGAKARFSPSNDGSVPPVAFTWKGRDIRAAASREGRVFLLDGNGAASTTLTGSLATWEDAKGNRWIYAAGSRSGIVAFMLSGEASRPELSRLWSRSLEVPLSPVIAGGILFALAGGSKSTHATLYALDAVTGKELYSSGSAVTSFTHSGGLAVANGHVCFGTSDNTLYCFGLPLEI